MLPRVVSTGMEIENHVYIFSRQAWKKLSTDRQFEIYQDLLEQYSILLKVPMKCKGIAHNFVAYCVLLLGWQRNLMES